MNSILSEKEFSEEKESKDRSGELDTKVFVETCDKIKKLFDQMLEVRKTGSKKNAAKVNHLVVNGFKVLLIDWGLDIGSTDTEAASVSAQRGVSISVWVSVSVRVSVSVQGGASVTVQVL